MNDKQFRIRLETSTVETALDNFNKPLTLLITHLLNEYNRNKNLRLKINKNINKCDSTY